MPTGCCVPICKNRIRSIVLVITILIISSSVISSSALNHKLTSQWSHKYDIEAVAWLLLEIAADDGPAINASQVNIHSDINSQFQALRHSRNRHRREHGEIPATPSTIPKNATFTVRGLEKESEDSGPWGPWEKSGVCSRPCNGGVAYFTRTCEDTNADGSHSCVGPVKKYYSCNVQDCPPGTAPFRATQCGQFNTLPFEGKYYSWVPYSRAPNKCELNCMPKGERFYFRHAKKVIDGTSCYDDGRIDVCVDGICLQVGCDKKLGSDAKEDKCRQCGGDGSSCETISGTFDLDNLRIGYNDILLIPAGATNIHIKEIARTSNYLAVRNSTGGYYLNGYWSIDFPRDKTFAGTLFHYERKPHGYKSSDSLRALGPTTEPIFIALLFQEKNKGVMYEYSVPQEVAATHQESYTWVYDEFGECSATCGGGFQTRSVSCTKSISKESAPDYLCDALLQPAINKSCSNQPCPASWKTGEWEDCSSACGDGIQFRNVFCQQVQYRGIYSLVDENECSTNGTSKPENKRPCKSDGTCPEWVAGPWSVCDKLCGPGSQTRKVACQSRDSSNVTENLNDENCDSSSYPETNKTCSNGPCEGVEWIISAWSGCDTCGLSAESRDVRCANSEGKHFSEDRCETSRRPENSQLCNSTIECDYQWFASEWSKAFFKFSMCLTTELIEFYFNKCMFQCSASCGNGIQARDVFCGIYANDTVSRIGEENCDQKEKYNTTRECIGQSCDAVWFMGPWSRCSSPCGGGNRKRKIMCLGESQLIPEADCDSSLKPEDMESCNIFSCDPDEIMVIDGCKNSKHGCCPDGMTPAGPNYKGCPEIKSDKPCSESKFGCCLDELTAAIGPFSISMGFLLDFNCLYTFVFREGCPDISSCNETKFGCCQDDVSPAKGPHFEGCTDTAVECSITLFGCCSDQVTIADDVALSNCEKEIICSDTAFGCCLDGVTAAIDANFTNCVSLGECENSTFGCCPDGITVAMDANLTNCEESCHNSTFGCCSDGITVALDIDFSNCAFADCNNSTYGCCHDNITPALDANLTNCQNISSCEETAFGCCSDGITAADDIDLSNCENVTSCDNTTFGCCPDGITVSLDANFTGCDNETDCKNTEYGCCPDGVSASDGPDYFGCIDDGSADLLCVESPFGCCIDEITPAQGLNGTGCENITVTDCSNSTFGCCIDGITSAQGLNGTGCENITVTDCSNSTYGCCPNGIDAAAGENFEECDFAVDCDNSTFGCCPDNVTAANGLNFEGCPGFCENSTFGCCEDNITSATGLNFEGCPGFCENSTFGCCEDNITSATGLNFEGCPGFCENSTFGCCEDNITSATGLNFEGCPGFCENSTFGCCEDNITSATGLNYEGCPVSCENSTFGCCEDNITSANGTNFEGCQSQCFDSHYGCCQDNITSATGPDFKGCENVTETSIDCFTSEFNCCPDNKTAASGLDYKGCACDMFEFGCCPDGVHYALGPRFLGCTCHYLPDGCCQDGYTPAKGANFTGCTCDRVLFDCCPDGKTPARGPHYNGCGCETMHYGCCFDNTTVARGPNYEGCGCETTEYGCCHDQRTPARGPSFAGCDCRLAPHGCCYDGRTHARGPNFEGCDCRTSQFGCCPDSRSAAEGPNFTGCDCSKMEFGCCYDGKTPARGPNFEGCDCSRMEFGCCYDGRTPARGPNFEGCDCRRTQFRCCHDNKTPARGPNYAGCPCDSTPFGCCKDEVTVAPGPNFLGCPGTTPKSNKSGEVCGLPNESGNCRTFSVQWYYDTKAGDCNRFWYGGCKGNGNRFETKEECSRVCVDARGKDACKLPLIKGTCNGNVLAWGYSNEIKSCVKYTYGGCLGNNNRFQSQADCEATCKEEVQDPCQLSLDPGPCNGRQQRFYFDKDSKLCQQFNYGGCEGNKNNFQTLEVCEKTCNVSQTVEVQKKCFQAKEVGSCVEYQERYYYDDNEKRCRRFIYGGCDGNENNFQTRESCEASCISAVPTTAPDFKTGKSFILQLIIMNKYCFLDYEIGPCTDSAIYWYYDYKTGICDRFYFSGCDGNQNRFKSRSECEQKCGNAQELCELPKIIGTCSQKFMQWYYDSASDNCFEFFYSGCRGNRNRFNSMSECNAQCLKRTTTTMTPTTISTLASTTESTTTVSTTTVSPTMTTPIVTQRPIPSTDVPIWTTRKPLTLEARNINEHIVQSSSEKIEVKFKWNHIYILEICRLPEDKGSCSQRYEQYFYNVISKKCELLEYSGCGGNANRFATLENCKAYCERESPAPVNVTTETNEDVCRLPLDKGPCDDDQQRWHFDVSLSRCVRFSYGGCDGNKNRFKSYELCTRFCSSVKPKPKPKPECEGEETCRILRCPFGVEESVDIEGCRVCQCYNPCRSVLCESGQRCVIDVDRSPSGDIITTPICRFDRKPGTCPKPADPTSGSCIRQCNTDADCRRSRKCCSDGCSLLCKDPEAGDGTSFETITTTTSTTTPTTPTSTTSTTSTTTPTSSTTQEPITEDDYKPKVIVTNPNAIGEVGQSVRLTCEVDGTPPPAVVWFKDLEQLPLNEEKYVYEKVGSLEILFLEKSDSGGYTCLAYNTFGQTRGDIRLSVTGDIPTTQTPPTGNGFSTFSTAAPFEGDPEPPKIEAMDKEMTVKLGSPVTLRCKVSGVPKPEIVWYKGGLPINNDEERYKILTNGMLQIPTVTREDSDRYRCLAYNPYGQADAAVQLDVEGFPTPVVTWWWKDRMLPLSSGRYQQLTDFSLLIRSVTYNEAGIYTCRAADNIGHIASQSIRVVIVFKKYKRDTDYLFTDVIATRQKIISASNSKNSMNESVSVVINKSPEPYTAGSTVTLDCVVLGHPKPRFGWYFNSQPLRPSQDISMFANGTLILQNITSNHTGIYQCLGANEISQKSSFVDVMVKSKSEDFPECTDNPYFADCDRIVQGDFCSNTHYSKYCCRSCYNAGKIDPSTIGFTIES
ncbi:Papilin [Nymphon striatum]|nr:Papilin [Nymphon striatum]